jgi:hypothetical protein
MQKYLIPFLLGAFIFSSCPNNSDDFDPVRIVPGDLMGMVHAGNRSEVAQEYALLDELGVTWMLTDFSWGSIQPEKDRWNLDAFKTYTENGKTHGKKILAILDYDTNWLHPDAGLDGPLIATPEERELFCEYVRKTVEHYKDQVDAWCIWNEPNLQPRFWASAGTKEQFFALTKEAAAAIREVDPDAFIIGGAFNTTASDDWVRGIFTSGAMAQIDAIAYHPYMISPGSTAYMYRKFKGIVSRYGFGDRIWITEVGYPTNGTYGTEVAEDNMPETVMQTIVLLAVEGAERILWYELFDHGDAANKSDAENWFGLINGDGLKEGKFERRKGAYAYQLCARNIPGTTVKTPERQGLSQTVQAYYFEGANGSHALAVWNEATIISRDIQVYLPGSEQNVYNLATGEAAPIGSASNYTLKDKDGVNHYIQFFTWKNTDLSQPPRISSR